MAHEQVYEYLKEIGIIPDQFDVRLGSSMYLREMERKLAIPELVEEMMPTYITMNKESCFEEPTIVIDAGGTNLRIALVTIQKDAAVKIENFSTHLMPGSNNAVDKEYFFDEVVHHLKPIIDKSNHISICFSYPLLMTSCNEGVVLQLSKQIQITGMVGTSIAQGLRDALARNGVTSDKHIVVLNDSTAVLLSGGVQKKEMNYSSYVGFILGTGINMAYIESSADIAKISSSYANEHMVINMETSRYAIFPRSIIDIEMDEKTIDPGDYQFEKMVSGKYLGELCRILLQHAASDELFSESFAEQILKIDSLSSRDVSEFLTLPKGKGRLAHLCESSQMEDEHIMYLLLAFIIDRAAMYCATAISGVIRKTGCGVTPMEPVCIVAEGGTYKNFSYLRNRLHYYLQKFLTIEENIYYKIVTIEDAALIGAAVAAGCDVNEKGGKQYEDI